MTTGRVEAFSDGVIAVIITIMVLEMKAPTDTSAASLAKIAPVFSSYVLSFLVVAIMWVNHHNLMHTVRRADARVLWTNNLLLFWMSLIPFVTAYMGQNHMSPLAVACYGGVMTLAGASFALLRHIAAIQHRDDREMLAHHARVRTKSTLSALAYAASVPLAFVTVYLSYAIFVLIPLIYFRPEAKDATAAK